MCEQRTAGPVRSLITFARLDTHRIGEFVSPTVTYDIQLSQESVASIVVQLTDPRTDGYSLWRSN